MVNDNNQPEVLGSEHDVHSIPASPSNGDNVELEPVKREYYIKELELTHDKLEWLWNRFSDFPQAWDDYTAGNYRAFCSILGNRNSVFFEVYSDPEFQHPVGLLSLSAIIPHHMAEAHCVFWDRSFQGRDASARDVLKRLFKEFDLKRISAFIPEMNRPACKFAKRLGMRHEGTLRRAALYQGQFIDMMAFGILKEEVDG